MTIVEILEDLRDWFDEHLCKKLTLKLPTENMINGEVEFVHPATFALYVPAKDRIPPNIKAPIPSLVIQLLDGEDKTVDHRRKLSIRLCLAAWNPGKQSDATLVPKAEPSAMFGRKYHEGEADIPYIRSLDGWRDVWNFVDSALDLLEKSATVAGMRVVKEDGIQFGPFTEEGAIWDYYPYWHSWIKFTVECGILAHVPEYDFL